MKEHALVFYERLIRIELKEREKEKLEPDRSYYFKTADAIHAERERVLRSLSMLLSEGNEMKIERRVRSYQEKLVNLLEIVSDQFTKDELKSLDCSEISEDNTWHNLYRLLYSYLAEILWNIETEFTRYLDIHVRVPTLYLMNARTRISAEVPTLINFFSKKGICEKLLVLLTTPFTELVEYEDGSRFTYHKLFYIKIMLHEMAEVAAGTHNDITDVVWRKLQELNFNTDDFLDYCTTRIIQDLGGLPKREVLERLLLWEKEVSQLHHKPGIGCHLNFAPLNQRLQIWVAAELKYYAGLEQLQSEPFDLPAELLKWKDFKIHTKFSVSQIGQVLRLVMDAGFYTNDNKSDVLEFFATFFTSQRQTSISIRSLRKHFYNNDAAASGAVRDILLSLINQSKKG